MHTVAAAASKSAEASGKRETGRVPNDTPPDTLPLAQLAEWRNRLPNPYLHACPSCPSCSSQPALGVV